MTTDNFNPIASTTALTHLLKPFVEEYPNFRNVTIYFGRLQCGGRSPSAPLRMGQTFGHFVYGERMRRQQPRRQWLSGPLSNAFPASRMPARGPAHLRAG